MNLIGGIKENNFLRKMDEGEESKFSSTRIRERKRRGSWKGGRGRKRISIDEMDETEEKTVSH